MSLSLSLVLSRVRRIVPTFAWLLAGLLLLAACGDGSTTSGTNADADSAKPPATGICRNLTRVEMAEPSNAGEHVACSEPHNSTTFASGELPDDFAKADYDDPDLDTWAYGTCMSALEEYLDAGDSTLMRSLFTWVWFRPSEDAWDEGARWYRCDLLAGGDHGQHYLDLPTTTQGLLTGKAGDQWMACARGSDVNDSPRVACNQAHGWRAVTTIKVGEAGDPWPGEKAVESKTKQFCSSSVAAWLNYPTDYNYAYTWFGKAEWKAGNRRSICWAKTDQ
ncbi:MAG: septum formation family protein [Nocardioides sp.]|uniref:septum formation family protein n=1 Tax=Nocardioides sp. TaxID=35761 RepID=UPI0039E6582C